MTPRTFYRGHFRVELDSAGNMTLTPRDEESLTFIRETLADAVERGENGHSVLVLADVLESGWLDSTWILGDMGSGDFGGLTSAPCLTEDYVLTDRGYEPSPDLDRPHVVFAHMDYQVQCPVEAWARGEGMRWIRAESEVRDA